MEMDFQQSAQHFHAFEIIEKKDLTLG